MPHVSKGDFQVGLLDNCSNSCLICEILIEINVINLEKHCFKEKNGIAQSWLKQIEAFIIIICFLTLELKKNSTLNSLKGFIRFSYFHLLFLNCRYGLGWRGGTWYANRKFRKEQMKLLGQIKPRGWQLLGRIKPRGLQFQFLKRQLRRSRMPESAAKTPEKMIEDTPTTRISGVNHQ